MNWQRILFYSALIYTIYRVESLCHNKEPFKQDMASMNLFMDHLKHLRGNNNAMEIEGDLLVGGEIEAKDVVTFKDNNLMANGEEVTDIDNQLSFNEIHFDKVFLINPSVVKKKAEFRGNTFIDPRTRNPIEFKKTATFNYDFFINEPSYLNKTGTCDVFPLKYATQRGKSTDKTIMLSGRGADGKLYWYHNVGNNIYKRLDRGTFGHRLGQTSCDKP